MNDHSHFEELAALKAGGFLSNEELSELSEHTKGCVECLNSDEEFGELVGSGLPLTVSPVREFLDKAKTRSDSGLHSRFLQRARLEGAVFSAGVERSARNDGRRVSFFVAAATALATAALMFAFYGTYGRLTSRESTQSRQVDQLRRENAALTASLSQSNGSVATGQREIQNLRAQLRNLATSAENLQRNSEHEREGAQRSSSQNAHLLDESLNQEKLLAEARDEAARSSQLRVDDEASMVEQQTRITELTNKLRIANATLDQERQLTAAGKDIRELMAARQLHVIDVHESDSSGNPRKPFGRVFLTEGKSLTFYAFDLNEDRVVDAKRSFQVWAASGTGKDSSRSLGFLHVDGKAQGRWVLKVENPELVKEISSVFVTVEPAAGGKQPSGQKMLYAYLSDANHP
jgi:hypothetical protein